MTGINQPDMKKICCSIKGDLIPNSTIIRHPRTFQRFIKPTLTPADAHQPVKTDPFQKS
jgi:hypothetical protein